MKILHLADLHIGRRFHDVSLIDDQSYMLNQIIQTIRHDHIDVLIVAGDIYDKNNPSEASFNLWDEFLTRLASIDVDVIIVSGNHDSQERLAFGARIFGNHRIHIKSYLDEDLSPITIGKVRFYTIPFVRPSMVRNVFEDFNQTSYEDAYQFLIRKIGALDNDFFNVFIGHQYFVYNNEVKLSDSETLSLGGLDAINITNLEHFDYVACGHIHRSQQIGSESCRYAGSLLKYSFSETHYEKRFPLLTIDTEHNLTIDSISYHPLRDVRVIEGPFHALLQQDPSDDFIKAIITDHTEIHDAINRLRAHYPNVLTVESTQDKSAIQMMQDQEHLENMDPLEIIEAFFMQQNNNPMTQAQRESVMETLSDLEGKS